MTAPDWNRAAAMAYRCLVRLKVRDLPVDPRRMLLRCRNTRLMTCDEAAEVLGGAPLDIADAWTYRFAMQDGGKRYLVCYQADGNPARLRFSLAHELGHIVLSHRGTGEQEEREADFFAMHLLCPRPVVQRMSELYQPLYGEQVAAACYVSRSAAEALERCTPCHVDQALEKQVADQLAAAVPTTLPVPLRGRPLRIASFCTDAERLRLLQL